MNYPPMDRLIISNSAEDADHIFGTTGKPKCGGGPLVATESTYMGLALRDDLIGLFGFSSSVEVSLGASDRVIVDGLT